MRRATGLLASGGKSKSTGNWIADATQNKGGLHRSLGIAEDKKIPPAKVAAAAKRGGRVGAQARLAQNLERLRK